MTRESYFHRVHFYPTTSTTMKYVHVDDDMKRAAIAMMEAMDAASA